MLKEEYLVKCMKEDLNDSLKNIEAILGNEFFSETSKKLTLSMETGNYKRNSEEFKSWGYDFPEEQEKYKSLIIQIKKYLPEAGAIN